jgi:hypothetical protein
MPEKSGLPRVRIQNTTLPGVEYEIQEALNGTSKYKNQDQRRKGRSFAQCPKSRPKPHAAVQLLRNLSNTQPRGNSRQLRMNEYHRMGMTPTSHEVCDKLGFWLTNVSAATAMITSVWEIWGKDHTPRKGRPRKFLWVIQIKYFGCTTRRIVTSHVPSWRNGLPSQQNGLQVEKPGVGL